MNYRSLFDELVATPAAIAPAPKVILRPYQREAVEAVFQAWEQHASALVVLPTGTGKSVVFSEVMRRHRGGRMLVMAHRAELIYQAVGHAKSANLTAGVEMGGEFSKREDVIVTSVQTMTAVSKCRHCRGEGCDVCQHRGAVRRMTKFNPMDFSLVVIDEAHHATAKTYRMVLHWFRKNPDLRVLLVTATPKRSDKIGLHNVADVCAYKMDLRAAIAEGWLCQPRQRFVVVDELDLSRVNTKAGGDLADGDLERAMLGKTTEEEQHLLHSITWPTIQEADGRPGLVFASGCEHALKLTAAFNAYDGVSAECVIESTDKAERKRIVERYQQRVTQFLVGVGCFTEGFDAPATEVIAIARPTKSESLYLQMIGRATRPLPGVVDGPETAAERLAAIANSGKPFCTVLDFVGNCGRHKLVSVADVLAGDDVHPEDLDAAIADAKLADHAVDMDELIARAKAAREERERREREEKERRRERTTHRAVSAKYHAQDVDLFGGDKFAFLENYDPGPSDATEKQVRLLVRLGVKPETAMSYSRRQASKEIDSISQRRGRDFVLPFGKFSGRRLADVPIDYIRWIEANGIGGPKLQAAIREMKATRQI